MLLCRLVQVRGPFPADEFSETAAAVIGPRDRVAILGFLKYCLCYKIGIQVCWDYQVFVHRKKKITWVNQFGLKASDFRSARTSWNTFVGSCVRSFLAAKNLDQLYSSINASQSHITIHIPKAHDTYYPLMSP